MSIHFHKCVDIINTGSNAIFCSMHQYPDSQAGGDIQVGIRRQWRLWCRGGTAFTFRKVIPLVLFRFGQQCRVFQGEGLRCVGDRIEN
jgi:hypothetical protein